MDISERLKCVAKMIEKCDAIADIGTDHAYLPIYLVKNNVCKRAIASDINIGPVKKAELNVNMEKVENKIECRLGAGFKAISSGEVNVAVIAGMGGNLIRDIIQASMDVFKSLDYVVLQPVQNPEVLREYIYECGFHIIDEALCIDENRYYEIIKVKYAKENLKVDPIYYEISKKLIEKKQPIVKDYIFFKIKKYDKIFNNIHDEGEMAKIRREDLSKKIEKLKEMLKCL